MIEKFQINEWILFFLFEKIWHCLDTHNNFHSSSNQTFQNIKKKLFEPTLIFFRQKSIIPLYFPFCACKRFPLKCCLPFTAREVFSQDYNLILLDFYSYRNGTYQSFLCAHPTVTEKEAAIWCLKNSSVFLPLFCCLSHRREPWPLTVPIASIMWTWATAASLGMFLVADKEVKKRS